MTKKKNKSKADVVHGKRKLWERSGKLVLGIPDEACCFRDLQWRSQGNQSLPHTCVPETEGIKTR